MSRGQAVNNRGGRREERGEMEDGERGGEMNERRRRDEGRSQQRGAIKEG